MTARNYGGQGVAPFVQPDKKPASIADTVVADHFWTTDGSVLSNKKKNMTKVIVSLLSSSDSKLRVKWNGTATASDWDVEVTPGNFVPSPDGIYIGNVSLYSDGATATFGTEYQVQGIE